LRRARTVSLRQRVVVGAAMASTFAIGAVLAGCGGAALPGAGSAAEDTPRERVAVALRLEDAGVRAGTDLPETRVVLALIREADGRTETHRADLAEGACTHAAPSAGALATVGCWWAGAGARYDLVRSGDALVVRRVRLDVALPRELPAESVLRVALAGVRRPKRAPARSSRQLTPPCRPCRDGGRFWLCLRLAPVAALPTRATRAPPTRSGRANQSSPSPIRAWAQGRPRAAA
jgi:hypothetical protein